MAFFCQEHLEKTRKKLKEFKEICVNAKLTKKDVGFIKMHPYLKTSQDRKFNISSGVVRSIKRGDT